MVVIITMRWWNDGELWAVCVWQQASYLLINYYNLTALNVQTHNSEAHSERNENEADVDK